jgi:hypothetical protein
MAGAHETAHELTGPNGTYDVAWHTDHISHVYSAGYPDSFGLSAFFNRHDTQLVKIDGQNCVTANFLAFDIDDHFAFDIDETVTLQLRFYQPRPTAIFYSYDKNDVAEPVTLIEKPSAASGPWQDVTVKLDRSRFAGRGIRASDIALATQGTFAPGFGTEPSMFTLCGLKIVRSNATKPPRPASPIDIRVLDEKGQQTKARIGLYDDTGKDVTPNASAISLQFYDRTVRQIKLRGAYGNPQPWPHSNRNIFYIDGRYRAKLPVGKYTLVVAKGPEFTYSVRTLDVGQGKPAAITVRLERAINMPAKGWYSGDVHIHLSRRAKDNQRIMKFLSAEDIHLSNLLQADNLEAQYYLQYAFGPKGRFQTGDHALAAGLEAPRTGHRGHIIALNPLQQHRNPARYLLYNETLDKYHQDGALTGYAHVGADEFHASWGLALDVPLGRVDFVEVLQNGRLGTGIWYGLLNLGYRIAPVAGSDFPYYDQPGAVRSYVKIDGDFTIQKWFDGLKAGRTFVTNGPMLEFTANGIAPGSALMATKGSAITVKAAAWLNPSLGKLDGLEMVFCGDVIATAPADSIDGFAQTLTLPSSGWLAVRARGSNATTAHSTPIYVDAGDGHSWCPSKVPDQVALMLKQLDEFEHHEPDMFSELEYWNAHSLADRVSSQKAAMNLQINMARDAYRVLLTQLGSGPK